MNLNYLVNDKRELSFKELDGNAQKIALQEIKYDLWDLYGVELDEQNQNEYLDCFTFKPTYDRAGTCRGQIFSISSADAAFRRF